MDGHALSYVTHNLYFIWAQRKKDGVSHGLRINRYRRTFGIRSGTNSRVPFIVYDANFLIIIRYWRRPLSFLSTILGEITNHKKLD